MCGRGVRRTILLMLAGFMGEGGNTFHVCACSCSILVLVSIRIRLCIMPCFVYSVNPPQYARLFYIQAATT